MLPVKWHHYRWHLVTSKITFAVWNFSFSHTSANTACIICYMFTHESKSARGSETVLVWVVLLRTTNRKLYMAYQMEGIPMTLSHLQSHSLLQAFQMKFFVPTLSCGRWQDFNWQRVARSLCGRLGLAIVPLCHGTGAPPPRSFDEHMRKIWYT